MISNILKTVTATAALAALLSTAGCAQDAHKHGAMGAGIMGGAKPAGCAMMQNGKAGMSGGEKPKDQDVASKSGCKMMENAAKGAAPSPAKEPSDTEDHTKHH